MSIANVLKKDNEMRSRTLTNKEGLYTSNSVDNTKTWNYPCPTLTKNRAMTRSSMVFPSNIANIGNFCGYEFESEQELRFEIKNCENVKVECDIPSFLPFEWTDESDVGVMVAGGHVSNFFLPRNYCGDIDIFFYGYKSEEDANDKLISLCKVLLHNYQVKYIHRELEREIDSMKKKLIRCKSTEPFLITKKLIDGYKHRIESEMEIRRTGETVTIPCMKVQFIARLYRSRSEILHGFDLGSSAIGYDGENVYFTELSKFCYEYMVNILDLSRRSTTYENRLIKYLNRGFDIVLPNMDVSKLSNDAMTKFKLPNTCFMKHIAFTYCDAHDNRIVVDTIKSANQFSSDYESFDEIEDMTIFYINLAKLVRGDAKLWVKGFDVNSVILDPRILEEHEVKWLYRAIQKEIESGVFPEHKINKYFCTPADTVFSARKNLEPLIQSQINLVISRLPNSLPLMWRVDNPGSQLTSSFHPQRCTNEEWYGNYIN